MKLRSTKDESGVALALAIMIVVVAGVMGAGLLVFVRGDIQSAAQANQGQWAFYIADAGTKAAAREILSEARPESYDDDGASNACNATADDPPISSVWSAKEGGRTQTLSGGEFTVSIRYVWPGCADPGTGPKPGAVYFEVISTGTYNDARRRIEAVYSTSETGAPLAVFAAGDVTLGGTATISGGSVFSGGDVNIETGAKLSGDDGTYGDWKQPGYNETSRGVVAAGIGAAGNVTGNTTAPVYDKDTAPKFVAPGPSAGQLTYPFAEAYWSDVSRRDFMREEAALLVNTSGNLNWPDGSTANTVVYVDLSSAPGDVEITSSECNGTDCLGTLVVEGGGVNVGSGAVFRGNVVTFGDEGDDLTVSLEANSKLEGTVASGEDIIIEGEVSVPSGDSYLAPGMHGVDLESWRELYG